MSDKEVLKVKELQITDEDGNPRITLGLDDNGNSSMKFIDSNKTARVTVGSDNKGPSSISLADSDGETRILAMVAENGSSYLFLYDRQGVTRLQVEVGSADITTIVVGGKNKKPLLKSGVDSPDGLYEQGSMSLYDSNGNMLSKAPQKY